RYSAVKLDGKEPSYPFTQQELTVWKEHGAKFPMKLAVECIETVSATHAQRYPDFSTEIDDFRKQAVEYANRISTERVWSPPFQPDDLLRELATERTSIQAARTAALKKNEEEYGAWE